MSQTPSKIAGFEILQQLGSGGSGQVYKARQISLGRDVALKVLNPGLVDSAEDIERFRREAQVAARLKHPGIVQVYEFGEEKGVHFIAMEYVSGYSVTDWLERKGTLAESDTIAVSLGVARALEYAWDRQKLVHYDIKPDNVLIDEDGTVKVVDLGLALLLGTEPATPGDTTFHCTPNYASPEHIEGKIRTDFRTDMYSLGAMMYHLLTGKLPFAQHTDTEVLRLQMSGEIEDPHQVNPAVSIGMAQFVRRLMAKNPDDRYPSWAEVIADLDRLSQGEWPVQPLPADRPSTLVHHKYERKTPGRREVRVNAPPAARAAGPHTGQVAQPRRSSPAAMIVVALLVVGGGAAGFSAMQRNQHVKERQAIADRDFSAAAALEEAVALAARKPQDHDGAAALFERAAKDAEGTGFELLAQTQASIARAQKKRQIQKVLQTIADQTRPLVRDGRHDRAAVIWRKYDGPLADATRNARDLEASRLEQQAKNATSPDT